MVRVLLGESMLKRLLSLPERVEIIRDILSRYPEEEDESGTKYIQVPLDDLTAHGLPASAKNPAYWSGTSPGLRACIQLGMVTFFSRKNEYIRFLAVTPEDKLVWQDRVRRAQKASIFKGLDKGLIVEGDEDV